MSYSNPVEKVQYHNPKFCSSICTSGSGRIMSIQHREKFQSYIPYNVPRRVESKIDVWNTTENYLREIPQFYCLQRSHITIADVSPRIISERIVNALKKLNISATFHTKKISLCAKTQDSLIFKINMFKNIDNDKVIVEAQKLSGRSVSFRNTRVAIFRAAQGLSNEGNNICLSPPQSTIRCSTIQISPLEDEHILSALKQCENMLNHPNLDSNLLGIQMLQNMTDLSATVHAVALLTAKIIIGGNDQFPELSKKFLSILMNPVLGCWHEKYSLEGKISTLLSYEVLRVLTNSLILLDNENDETLGKILETRSHLLCDELVTVLIIVVGDAKTHPHDAQLSAKCLNTLVRHSQCAYNRAVQQEAFRTETCHDMLAIESTKVLGSFDYR